MKKAILFFAVLFIFETGMAQPETTDAEAKAAISKLAFIAGKWKGSGWMMGRDRTKAEFNQAENIQFKLDSTILLIEGMGKTNGTVIHDALAIVSYNKDKSEYAFQSFLHTGRKGTFKAELKGEKLYWYPSDNMRYIIWINEKGQWYETGEYNREGQWFQFFEMTLDKTE